MDWADLHRKRDELLAEVRQKNALFEERALLLREIRSLEALSRALETEVQCLQSLIPPKAPSLSDDPFQERLERIELALTAVLKKQGVLPS